VNPSIRLRKRREEEEMEAERAEERAWQQQYNETVQRSGTRSTSKIIGGVDNDGGSGGGGSVIFLVDTASRFPGAGAILGWQLNVKRVGPVKLQVWRRWRSTTDAIGATGRNPASSARGKQQVYFELVGENSITPFSVGE
jgi:hypothetical protein